MKEKAVTYYTFPEKGSIVSSKKQLDALNTKNCRNENNVNTLTFNCGGYALETFNWFLPIKNKDFVAENAEEEWLILNAYDNYWDCEEDINQIEAMDNYIDDKIYDGEMDILGLVSEITLPEGVDIVTAENDALDLYQRHNYFTPTALQIAALNMLKAFPDMRKIKSWEELKPDEYGIAYRGNRHDFHFIKYDQITNKYTHKLGYQAVEEISSLKEGFNPEAGFQYDSETIYFAKKRKIA